MTIPKFRNIKINAYKPGRSRVGRIHKVIKVSANESALGISPKAKKVIFSKNRVSSKYPDGKSSELRKEISKVYNCNYDKIICGSGSDEIIQMICQLYLNPMDEVIVSRYSFLMYRIYAKIVNAKVVFAKEKNFKTSVEEVLKKVSKKTKIVFLANPNNPTGTYLNKSELTNLRKRLDKKILLVLDDAYFEYMKNKNYKSGLDMFKNKNNVIILRTFSKIYGLAALRVGWGYGPKKIIQALYKIKPPFNVNQVAQTAAIISLKDKDFVKKSIKHNIYWAVKIKNFLKKLNVFTNEISANFFLLDFDKSKLSAKYVLKKLEMKGIILRSTEEGYDIKNKLRLTVGSAKENSKFMIAMNNIFKKK